MTRRAAPASMVLAAALTLMSWPQLACAATLDGATLSALWGLPFAGVLLSIAVFPLVAPAFWHHHFGKIAAAWALAFLAPFAFAFGADVAFATLIHALLEEYIPFIVLLTALYTVAGGICVRGNLHGTPRLNVTILALGTLLASVMGTTGAAMLLIRPLLRANDNRRHVVHVVVFFIFLVANAGGSLSPLGDPPLFLGFLQGVDFFWTTTHLALPMLFVCAVLLVAFYCLDSYYFHRREEERSLFLDPTPDSPRLGIDGKINFVLLGAVVGLVLMSGLWKPGVSFDVFGTHVALQNVVRDVALIGVTVLSILWTPRAARAGNDFNWAPIEEVAKLFAGIFVTIAPVITMLRAGEAGAFAGIVHLVNDSAGQPHDAMYFWATGLLSSFLDNAPTYLVFFNLAGGDAQSLMTTGATTLAAISAGAVFMGANSYIGNAPNFMVKSIAESRGVRMPSFFAYLGWSGAVLLPLFLVTGWLFF
ncbi:sodium:proton antiporter [Paraburkholderia sp. RL17-368-BIF-A]|jgi:Na+/H+ antiporter NhaD/arsenite permease-like protein|uniref:Na+/H+ antiporter NhaD/arsenite permease-like protein n=2 Tax=Paraburkholderia graminis TaxID=60548 RepID=A0ABD5CCW7_9BURK|nr:sodium:proton antiporter [Paraburkholderia graminis]ALE55515.1 sodium:proton antiporter [Burkholderia sp. HB1]MDQ0623963.1 Na+/H+ antiporter NhaD/arsenite permease-like protein [Paraburkholderia graminis]MDR6203080.1 Na+/H+ antiporter NhaD/arsenite permease-like protein [Paraburkholderia graminis]